MIGSTKTVVIPRASSGFGKGAVLPAGSALQDVILKEMQLDAVRGGVSP